MDRQGAKTARLRFGDRIAFILRDQTEVVMKPVTQTVDQVFGKLHAPGQPVKTIDEMNQAVARRMRTRRT